MNLPPIDATQTNILALPVKPRPSPEEGAMLQPVPYGKCEHVFTSFEVDVKAGKCRCKACGEEVGPMFVLDQLMKAESRWMRTLADYQDSMKRLAERSRCKCDHCGKMTRIHR
ncbi:hypothetical protein [Ottowia sp. VDI28]|uniref:hypothetical protein n=1 Tax=Ottowia sp. VDI28 TaxID=3133968 RepID=UPI003C3046E4